MMMVVPLLKSLGSRFFTAYIYSYCILRITDINLFVFLGRNNHDVHCIESDAEQ